MLNKIKNSFWAGLSFGILISFITAWVTWPTIPLDTEFIKGEKINLPKLGQGQRIYYPVDGTKVEDLFIVYGMGQSYQNEVVVELTNSKDQPIATSSVKFQSSKIGEEGQFAVLMNKYNATFEDEVGKLILYAIDPGGVRRQIGDFVNLRFK